MEGGERHRGKNPAVFLVKVLNFSDLALKSGKGQKYAENPRRYSSTPAKIV